jgi:A/G-specific adenine glycosylase
MKKHSSAGKDLALHRKTRPVGNHARRTALRTRIQTHILAWFQANQRDLPWRQTRDAYPIWISEIMLQQTQVSTVVPYFLRFLEAFPDVKSLASADEQEVLRLWEGLGYYRRARDLHRAARLIVERHGGQFPDDPEQARDLPGIGRYTLGAILSQAFGQHLPILEANSRRVLCRLFARGDDPRRGDGLARLWQTAEDLLPHDNPGDFNQALMELGALLCTATEPKCLLCPLKAECEARKAGLQETIPAPPTRPAVVEVRELALVVKRGPRVLLVKRPGQGRWANMWEFPHGPAEDVGQLSRELTGMSIRPAEELMTLRHGVTHHRITMTCFVAPYRSGTFRSSFYVGSAWLLPAQLADYPVSTPQRKLATRIARPPANCP